MAGSGSAPGLETNGYSANDRLDSWKEIASYLKREVRTVQRWEKSLALPVRRLADQQGVFAYKREIDAWWRERQTRIQEEEAHEETVASSPETDSVTIDDPGSRPAKRPRKLLRFRRWNYFLALLGAAILLLAAGLRLFWPRIRGGFWPRTEKMVLAVVPFKNMSGDLVSQHVADGLTEETVSRLGRLHPERLLVIALPPGNSPSLDTMGGSAKTDYLFEGSVRHAGQKVAITSQLIRVRDNAQVWGDTYERDVRDPEDIIPLEIEAAESLTSGVLSQVPHEGQVSHVLNRPGDEAYLKGRFFWNKRTTESLTKAVSYFQEAIQADPTYAPAYAGLADAYSLLGSAPYAALRPDEAFPKSEAAARKALELDGSLAEAHVSLGYFELVYRRNYDDAAKEFQKAIRLRPAYATAHQYYGYYLTAVGRVDEAIKEREIARELDPTSPLITSSLGEAYYQARQFRRTIEQNQKSLELDPSYAIALINIGRAYGEEGMHVQALDAFQKILSVAPDDPGVLALVGHEYAVSGRRADALRVLNLLKQKSAHSYVPALYFALIYTGLHEKEEAFLWLDRAYDERCDYLVYLPTEPMADPLRGDPRFSRLLKRLGLKVDSAITASTAP